MTEYYFLASLLPELSLGHIPAIGFSEFKELMRVNLERQDLKKVREFLRFVDYENLRSLWAGEPHDPRGNFTKEELKEALHNEAFSEEEPFPTFLKSFLAKYKSDEERLTHFHFLMSQFLDDEIEKNSGFLKEYFSFEKDLRLTLLGFRAKKMKKNLEAELQYEDSKDPIVAQILAQKDAKTYEPPFEFKELKNIFERYGDQPMELHKALTEYRFNEVQEMVVGDFFSIDRILVYLARLNLTERWLELDVQRGIEVIDTIQRKIS